MVGPRQGEGVALEARLVQHHGHDRDLPADAVDAPHRHQTRRQHVHESARPRDDLHVLRLEVSRVGAPSCVTARGGGVWKVDSGHFG